MSDTPRTDSRINEIMQHAGLSDDKMQMQVINESAPWQFARLLERELNEVKFQLISPVSPSCPEPTTSCVICAQPITQFDSYGVGKLPGCRYHWSCIKREAATVS